MGGSSVFSFEFSRKFWYILVSEDAFLEYLFGCLFGSVEGFLAGALAVTDSFPLITPNQSVFLGCGMWEAPAWGGVVPKSPREVG